MEVSELYCEEVIHGFFGAGGCGEEYQRKC